MPGVVRLPAAILMKLPHLPGPRRAPLARLGAAPLALAALASPGRLPALALALVLVLLAAGCATSAAPPDPAAAAVVATVPMAVSVPDLRGLSVGQARERLSAAGLLPGSAETTAAPPGMVWHQSLPAGSKVPAGTPIDMEVVEIGINPLGCPAPEPAALCAAAAPARSRAPAPWRHPRRPGPPRTPPGQLSP